MLRSPPVHSRKSRSDLRVCPKPSLRAPLHIEISAFFGVGLSGTRTGACVSGGYRTARRHVLTSTRASLYVTLGQVYTASRTPLLSHPLDSSPACIIIRLDIMRTLVLLAACLGLSNALVEPHRFSSPNHPKVKNRKRQTSDTADYPAHVIEQPVCSSLSV